MSGEDSVQVSFLPGEGIAEAGAVWRRLESSCGDRGIARSWDWTEIWLKHYGDAVAHRFAIAERGGTPVGAALLTESRAGLREGFGARRLHLGTAGEPPGEGIFVERNGVLAAPRDLQPVATALFDALNHERGWDELWLDGFVQGHADAFARALPTMRSESVPSPYADLATIRDNGGEVIGALRSSVRSRLRRSLRGFDELRMEWAETAVDAEEIFVELVRLHQARWREQGEPGAFANLRAVGFHRDLIARLAPRGGVVLFRVRDGERTVGCVYGFMDGDDFLFYQGGLGNFADSKLKPGLTIHALCMQECLERGIDAYDFLAGEARYKRELANAERPLAWSVLRRRRPRPFLAGALRTITRRPAAIAPLS